MAVIAQQPRSTGDRFTQKSSTPASAAAKPGSSAPFSNQRQNGASTSTSSRPASSRRPAYRGKPAGGAGAADKPKVEHEILFQKYFKSAGPRTYAAQMKRANNGNHYLVLTESKRDEKTNEPRKTRLYLYSEDFVAFFRMLHETAQFIRANPVPDAIRKRQEKRWSKAANPDRPASSAR